MARTGDKAEAARDAIYDAVTTLAQAAAEHSGPGGAAMLRDAAYAWRAAFGGTQPGASVVEGR